MKNIVVIGGSKGIGREIVSSQINLGNKCYNFSRSNLEISHNNGFLDQHKCLTESSPCLNYIYKFKDKKIFKILEFRDTNIKDIHRSIKILKQKLK